MASARRVWAFQVAVGLVGVCATGAALLVALTRIDFRLPSVDELVAACQRYALPNVRPASVVVLILGSVSLAAVLRTIAASVRQLRDSRRFERALETIGCIPGATPRLVFEDDQPHAFCIGMRRPRVYVSRAALELLADDELDAVLAHEVHHARRRDPLRLLVARALADGLFFLPLVRRLAERYAALAELAADEAAAAARGGRRALASALLAFDDHPTPAVGIAPERVEHLLGQRPSWELSTVLLLGAVVAIGLLLAVTVRVAEVTGHGAVGLPVLAAQACLLAMSLGPVVAGAMGLLGGRRLVRGRIAR
jgi:Zn-dependent protease with chaperone function